jgi:hypothetical protein
MARVLARQKPAWPPGTRHGYLTMSLGLYMQEFIIHGLFRAPGAGGSSAFASIVRELTHVGRALAQMARTFAPGDR